MEKFGRVLYFSYNYKKVLMLLENATKQMGFQYKGK